MENTNKKEFITAFAALMVGVGIFSDKLELVDINLGFKIFNLFNISIFVFSFLLLSIYLYAIDYARYGLLHIEDWRIFKFLQYIANFLYFASVILPLLILLLWLSVFLLNKIPLVYIKQYLWYISIVWSSSISLGSVVFLIIRLIQKEKSVREKISEQASTVLLKTDRLVKNKEWRLAVIEAFRLIELMFKNKAEEIGIDTNRFSFIHQLRIFSRRGLITKEQALKLDQVREFRNIAIHSGENITEEQAMYVIDVINEIGESLTYVTFTSGFFEAKAGSALSKLFPRHHIIHQFNIGKDVGIDFIAEGPNSHRYFIEVKTVKSLISIVNAVKQIESFFRNNNDRGLLILPSTLKTKLTNPNIKILYFDTESNKFSNHDEIKDWIYQEG